MKQLFAGLLALVMVLSTGMTAAAAQNDTSMGTGDKTVDVTASYHPSNEAETVYHVDIKWDSMSFSYTETGKKTWNPDTHTYSGDAGGKWDKTEASITVTNHSDVAVKVAVTYTPKADTGITGAITNGSATLSAGEVEKPEQADSLTATLKISGQPNASVTEAGVTIGTVTIRISPV